MCKRHYLVPAVNITVTYNNLISSIFCDILRACRISKMAANTRPSVDSEGLREPVYWYVAIRPSNNLKICRSNDIMYASIG